MELSQSEIHSELVQACMTGDLKNILNLLYYYKESVEKLIKGDVAFTYKTKYGAYKPGEYLFLACENNHPPLVEHLLKLGADPTQMHNSMMTPLLSACQKGNLEVLKLLHSHGVELHPEEVFFKDSPIYHCCRHGQVNILEFIIENVPGVLMKTTHGGIGTSPGHEYADIWAGLSKIAKSEGGFVIGNLLLYVGCIKRHVNVVKCLVNKGIAVYDILPGNTFYSALQSPLSAACRNKDLELAKYLLEEKAEITSSIANQYPEFTATLLERNVKKYRRSYSISAMSDRHETLVENPLSIYWESIGLHKIHRHWLESNANCICLIDIHDNKITDLPMDFFELLPNLEDLDLSCNELINIPSQGLENAKLTRILVCKNKLKKIPMNLFLNKHVNTIDLSQNLLQYLPPEPVTNNGLTASDEQWECVSLTLLKCSNNALQSIPPGISGAIGLRKLILSNNMLSSFSVNWKCPLNELDLTHNQLTEFTCLSQIVWSKTLQRLNLGHNNLRALSSNICHLQSLQHLDMRHNALKTLPPPGNWRCKVLNKLNLSHNMLTASCGPEGFVAVDKKKVADSISGSIQAAFNTNCEFPVALLSHCLQVLDLSYNQLEHIPDSICCLTSLCELDLSHNPSLRQLPAELGNLKNIWNLRLTNLNINDVPFTFDERNHAKTVLPYLRVKLRKSVPFNRMKLMVVGLQGRGKTTLIATLQGKKPPPNISTVGISVEQWSLSSPSKSVVGSLFRDSNEPKDILFSSWDLAGQHVYYATHQCFLTGKTLYLAVFNTTHGQEGIDSLGPWLLNIQARAPNSRVIVVGTHIDSIPNGNRKTVLDRMDQEIRYKYDKKGFPIISGCAFVSNTTGEGLSYLREKIYSVADQMNNSNEGIGKMAPLSYIQLYDSIVRETQYRKEMELPPVLTMDEMLILAQANPNNDIFDVEELITAAKFLHENGILLHFNDHLRELNTLFFIDPSWLCDMLSLVVTVRQINPFIVGGYIKKRDLMVIFLKNPRLPEQYIPQYFRLLERFEIALCLDDETFLIPAMLPKERPGLAMEKEMAKYSNPEKGFDPTSEKTNDHINRNYHMNYIPSGFWSRLIARIIIAVHKWGMILQASNNDAKLEKLNVTNEYSLLFWREGILVLYEDGYFLVESFCDEMEYENYSNEGVAISVWSKEQDFSVMGFIVDHLDMLITEWYPGLEDVDEYGCPLIQKLIPCPVCKFARQQTLENFHGLAGNLKENYASFFREPKYVNQFDLQVCALAATSFKAISCARHASEPVKLRLVVPDLLLTDLPSHYVINPDEFEFEPSEQTRLGEGGAGGVYRGCYQGKTIAVKQFHSATKTRYFDRSFQDVNSNWTDNSSDVFMPTDQTIEDHMEDGKVIRAFWDLRQEVAVLCRLQHPNVINFVGVCHTPLCFALELAPMGSLQTILEKLQNEREEKYRGVPTFNMCVGSVLSKEITHLIAFQVAHALCYLHESEIIYRDLKSDNVLVWSLNPDDDINVKISDYGISAFATPQGVIGEGGTPGFQAPEIKVGCAYDEKVDIFSYGVWLYELISGFRPYREYRTAAEMKKAVSRGIRPSLRKDGLNPNMPYLELLMEDCWRANPVVRPTCTEILARLETPEIRVLDNVFPSLDGSDLESVKCVSLWKNPDKNDSNDEEEKKKILLWCDQETFREYKIIDVYKERVVLHSICPGPRVLCTINVGKHVWLGTEGRQIEIFGQINLSDELTSAKPSVLWTVSVSDPVMQMVTYEKQAGHVLRVFASLANGTLLVLSKKEGEADEDKLLFNEEIEDIISNMKEKWSDPIVINLATKGLPAKCMTFTRNNTELWVGSGNMIIIINPDTYEILEQIQALRMKKHHLISCMATDGSSVWLSDRKSSIITQWDVETRTKLLKLQCNMENPLNQNLVRPVEFNDAISFEESFSEQVDMSPVSANSGISGNVANSGDIADSGNIANGGNIANSRNNEREDAVAPLESPVGATTPNSRRPNRLSGIYSKFKDAISRKDADTVDNVKTISNAVPLPSNSVPGKQRSSSNADSLQTYKPSNESENTTEKIKKEAVDFTPSSKLLTNLRKKPSLMVSKRSSKRRNYAPNKELLEHDIHDEMKNAAITRPRVSAWSGTLNRVTAIWYSKGALWVGRASGDILVINMDGGKLPNENKEVIGEIQDTTDCDSELGVVIAILGGTVRKQENCSKMVTSFVEMGTSKLASVLRMEPRTSRSQSVSVAMGRRRSVSHSFDKFQIFVFELWSMHEFKKFIGKITSLKNIEDEEEKY